MTIVAAAFLLPIVLLQVYTNFFYVGFSLTHDESEHLHVVFALARGERPYVDFIENHPVFFHLVLSWIARFIGVASVMEFYWLGKFLILAHFVGCLALLALFLRRFSPTLSLNGNVFALLIISISLLGVWTESSEWSNGHYALWHLRPDWLCNFYALACISLHYSFHQSLFRRQEKIPVRWIVVAGVLGGFSTAILAKSVYFFLPYAIAVFSICVFEPDVALGWWMHHRKKIFVGNALFVLAVAASYFLFVSLELVASGVGFADYIHANFTLNATKHIGINTEDFSPVNVLRSMLGFKILPAILLLVWFLYRSAVAQRRKDKLEYFFWHFLFLVVVVNICVPAFSNGLTWPHYFSSSLLVLVAVLAVGADTILARLCGGFSAIFGRAGNTPARRHLRWAAPVFAAAILLPWYFDKWQTVVNSLDNLNYVKRLYQLRIGEPVRDFLPEHLLPDDLAYLVFFPQSKPANARAWGYFFMLGYDNKLWKDANSLGFAPNPKLHWRRLYRVSPPDVITLSGKNDFDVKRFFIKRAQGVDIAWLWLSMQNDYTCETRKSLRVYVRNDLVGRFRGGGWSECREESEIELER